MDRRSYDWDYGVVSFLIHDSAHKDHQEIECSAGLPFSVQDRKREKVVIMMRGACCYRHHSASTDGLGGEGGVEATAKEHTSRASRPEPMMIHDQHSASQ